MELRYERPEDRPAAPAPLDRVQDFVNTRINIRDTGEFRDELSSPAALRNWMSTRGLMAERARVSRADVERVIVVREGLRALLARDGGADDDLRGLDEVAATLPLRVRIGTEAEPVLLPTARQGVEHALGTLLADTVLAHSNGTLSRLKACRDESCRWVFYDSSKNRSGTWCSMATCGSAAKKRQFSERRRQQRRG